MFQNTDLSLVTFDTHLADYCSSESIYVKKKVTVQKVCCTFLFTSINMHISSQHEKTVKTAQDNIQRLLYQGPFQKGG